MSAERQPYEPPTLTPVGSLRDVRGASIPGDGCRNPHNPQCEVRQADVVADRRGPPREIEED